MGSSSPNRGEIGWKQKISELPPPSNCLRYNFKDPKVPQIWWDVLEVPEFLPPQPQSSREIRKVCPKQGWCVTFCHVFPGDLPHLFSWNHFPNFYQHDTPLCDCASELTPLQIRATATETLNPDMAFHSTVLFTGILTTTWWFQPIWKILVKLFTPWRRISMRHRVPYTFRA